MPFSFGFPLRSSCHTNYECIDSKGIVNNYIVLRNNAWGLIIDIRLRLRGSQLFWIKVHMTGTGKWYILMQRAGRFVFHLWFTAFSSIHHIIDVRTSGTLSLSLVFKFWVLNQSKVKSKIKQIYIYICQEWDTEDYTTDWYIYTAADMQQPYTIDTSISMLCCLIGV